MKYIKAKEFEDFCKNQNRLIEILNHRMTQVENDLTKIKIDVAWLKKVLFYIAGILSALTITTITKLILGI